MFKGQIIEEEKRKRKMLSFLKKVFGALLIVAGGYYFATDVHDNRVLVEVMTPWGCFFFLFLALSTDELIDLRGARPVMGIGASFAQGMVMQRTISVLGIQDHTVFATSLLAIWYILVASLLSMIIPRNKITEWYWLLLITLIQPVLCAVFGIKGYFLTFTESLVFIFTVYECARYQDKTLSGFFIACRSIIFVTHLIYLIVKRVDWEIREPVF